MQTSMRITRLADKILLRVVAYYVVLAAVVVLLARALPDPARAFLARPLDEVMGGGGAGAATELIATGRESVPATDQLTLAVAALLAIVTAAALALPVSWLYILTRQKKGYRQSVVQTLIVLPIVVAGVVVLVKHSLALAFSLAGIVAAVRFRNTLEDSKDAVYIFLATGIGLASGVQVTVAVVLSVAFNLAVVLLWYTDFGRTPAALEGVRAAERMRRALAIANRTGEFVARVDEEILKAMAPEQLDALADRAWRRRRRMSPDFADDERPTYDRLLRLRTRDPGTLRELVEPTIGERLKRWRFGGVVHEDDGTHVVEYGVELKKSIAPDVLLDELRARGGAHVLDAEIR